MPDPADFIYTNGKVFTSNPDAPWAEAVATSGNSITYVGSSAGATSLGGDDTTVIDLGGKVLLPGIVASHEHPLLVMGLSAGLQLEQSDDKEQMLASVREYVRDHPDGAMFSTGGAFEGTVDITREDLDEIVSDRPFFMIGLGVHGGWCNSAALEAAGVVQGSPDPIYYFERDADDRPTGFVGASKSVVYLLGELDFMSVEAMRNTAKGVLGELTRLGITAVYDAGVPAVEESAFQVIHELEQAGLLNVRMKASVLTQGEHMNEATLEKGRRLIPRYSSDFFDVSFLKIHGDGAIENRTACLLTPYSDETSTVGNLSLTEQDAHTMVMTAAERGWDVHFHTIGDSTNQIALDCFEQARNAGYTENRFSTGHSTLVHPDNVQRYVDLDVTANVFAVNNCVPSEIVRTRIGDERYGRYQPNGTLDKAGVRVAMSADWPTADLSPWLQTAVCMERRNPGEHDFLGPAEAKMTAEEIMRAYTIDAAYLMGWEDMIGSLEVGKKADMIVVDTDIFEATAEQIAETQILTTMVDGKVVYSHLDGVMPEGFVATMGYKPDLVFL